jgi:hypothetical protein
MFEQSTVLNTIQLLNGAEWVHDLALIAVEVDHQFLVDNSDCDARAKAYQAAFMKEMAEKVIKSYTEFSSPVVKIQRYPLWFEAKERRRVYTPGWWLGHKPVAINLHRLPQTVFVEHRRYVWHEMLKEIRYEALNYNDFVGLSLPALIRTNLSLARLIRVAHQYTALPPVRQDFQKLDDLVPGYFYKFEPYWYYIDQLWCRRRRMDRWSRYFEEEETLRDVT